jgi:hypothetical protein
VRVELEGFQVQQQLYPQLFEIDVPGGQGVARGQQSVQGVQNIQCARPPAGVAAAENLLSGRLELPGRRDHRQPGHLEVHPLQFQLSQVLADGPLDPI